MTELKQEVFIDFESISNAFKEGVFDGWKKLYVLIVRGRVYVENKFPRNLLGDTIRAYSGEPEEVVRQVSYLSEKYSDKLFISKTRK